MPSFAARIRSEEWMDDFCIADERLTDSLRQLRLVNRYLGGYATSLRQLAPWLLGRAGGKTRLLDLGTGGADFPEVIVRWAARQRPPLDIEIVGIDRNPATVEYAKQTLASRLPKELLQRITLVAADALALPFAENSFDIAMAAMFLHHFEKDEAIRIVRAMRQVAKHGVLINDLQREPAAFFGIKALTRLLPASPMVRHDAPISVLRGFRHADLDQIAQGAGLAAYRLRRHWAFRWALSTVGNEE